MHKVLVIEDNYDNFRIIEYALKRAGYDVIHAENGEKGIELVIEVKPYFIIMDVNLPGIDGIEATHRIRALVENGNIPIIAITSYAMKGDMERVIAAGCNGYIEKPIDPITVVDRIHKIIGGGEK